MYYFLKPPSGKVAWNYFLLYKASRLKKYYCGTYYVPGKTILPLFNLPIDRTDERAFMKASRSDLEKAYKMLCVNCSLCCVENSGAFAFEHEYRLIKNYTEAFLPSVEVEAEYIGKLRIYRLDVGPRGRCVLYDVEKGCLVHGYLKPMICMIQYCSFFAEKNGEKYIKAPSKNKLVYIKASNNIFEYYVKLFRKRALKKST